MAKIAEQAERYDGTCIHFWRSFILFLNMS